MPLGPQAPTKNNKNIISSKFSPQNIKHGECADRRSPLKWMVHVVWEGCCMLQNSGSECEIGKNEKALGNSYIISLWQ